MICESRGIDDDMGRWLVCQRISFHSIMFHTFVLWHIELVSGGNSIEGGMVSEQKDLFEFTTWKVWMGSFLPLHCMVVDSFHHHRWDREYQKADLSMSVWIWNTFLKCLRMPTLNIDTLLTAINVFYPLISVPSLIVLRQFDRALYSTY